MQANTTSPIRLHHTSAFSPPSAGRKCTLTMLKFILVEMQTMGITFRYGAVLVVGLTLWIAYRIMRWVSGWTLFGFSYFLLRHLVYPNALGRSARVSSLTRLEMLLLCFYVAGNALCMGVGVESTAEA